ncbi:MULTISPECIES: adenylyltransferase/cytidyltransferase family protein [Streptomyces]|uniref:Adenylyltransferase/cytidyltransferase family protein n=2 Tax=Streptomyces TaxID=1883 RepID=A0ABV9J3Q5_9ACTN
MTRIGFAPGVYDLFHIGHLNILREARRHCDRLVVGVTSDELAFGLKGKVPVVPIAERLDIVRSVRFVDDAIVETEFDKLKTWKRIGFHVIFKGDDWRGTPKWLEYERRFGQVGVEVVYFPYTKHTSSTLLRSSLQRLSGIPAAQLPEPLHKEGGHEQHMGDQQRAIHREEEVLTSQE